MVPNKKIDNCLKRIQSGNKDALAELYNETKSSVYAYALSILKNKALAEEVLQDLKVKLSKNKTQMENNDKSIKNFEEKIKNLRLNKLNLIEKAEKLEKKIAMQQEKVDKEKEEKKEN